MIYRLFQDSKLDSIDTTLAHSFCCCQIGRLLDNWLIRYFLVVLQIYAKANLANVFGVLKKTCYTTFKVPE